MLNRIVIAGRLTRDPELRKTNSDSAVASFTLAVDDITKGPDGKNTTSFIGVSVFGKGADVVAKSLRKGSLVGVDGRIRQRSYINKEGRKVSVIEIIASQVEFLEPKGLREIPNEEVIIEEQEPVIEESKNLDSIDVTDDDLPF